MSKLPNIIKSVEIPFNVEELVESLSLLLNRECLEIGKTSYSFLTHHKYRFIKYVVQIETNSGSVEIKGKVDLDLMLENLVQETDFYDLELCICKQHIELSGLHEKHVISVLMSAYLDNKERMSQVKVSPEAAKVFMDFERKLKDLL